MAEMFNAVHSDVALEMGTSLVTRKWWKVLRK